MVMIIVWRKCRYTYIYALHSHRNRRGDDKTMLEVDDDFVEEVWLVGIVGGGCDVMRMTV